MATLKKGDKAPAFNLVDQDGKKVKLADFKGKKVLLYFYPKADTPGCTKQACSVRDARPELQDLGVAALGISPDGADTQKKFDRKHALAFPLLSDPDHKVAELYGAWGEKKMYGNRTWESSVRPSLSMRLAKLWPRGIKSNRKTRFRRPRRSLMILSEAFPCKRTFAMI